MEKSDSAKRKGMPLFQGCLMYFPDALLAVAEHSRKANEKHNPGEPLHWSKDKSRDHADCIARHLVDIGPDWGLTDPEFGSLHATALAWRALALLQTVIERERKAPADGWIPWAGGQCPVERNVSVLFKQRDGLQPSYAISAGYLRWSDSGWMGSDIIAYKVAPDAV